MLLQPSLSEPLARRENKRGDPAQRKRGKVRGTSPQAPPPPPHNYKAYQLYTLYRGKDGKIMQVRFKQPLSLTGLGSVVPFAMGHSECSVDSVALLPGSTEWLPV